MSDKAALLKETEDAFAELRQAIDGLDDARLTRVWLGAWSAREILVHVSGWHREMIAALERLARAEPPYPDGAYDDFDAWNARFVARQAGAKVAEVVAELDASHRDFVRAAAAVPESLFAPGGPARGIVEGTGPAHYREHAGQIQEWRRTVP